jgi:hypothetical protein
MENNNISSVEIMSLPLRYWFYKSNSLPQIGKLFQTNEDVTLFRVRRLSKGVDGLFTPYRQPEGSSASYAKPTPDRPKLSVRRFLLGKIVKVQHV